MTADVILIAPADRLPALTAVCASLGTVQAFAETDALAALDATFQWLPREVVLERSFADSPRGRAFLRRVTDDTFARECLIRILDAALVPAAYAAPTTTGLPVTPLADAMPGPGADGGTADPETIAPRATPRLGVAPGTVVAVDGTPVTLIDLSLDGMQALGTLPLKPNQMVRVTLPGSALGAGPSDADVGAAQGLRVRARVAWASLELGGATGPRYRAGFAFVDADRAALEPIVGRLTSAVL